MQRPAASENSLRYVTAVDMARTSQLSLSGNRFATPKPKTLLRIALLSETSSGVIYAFHLARN
jgi:hypothetical protein